MNTQTNRLDTKVNQTVILQSKQTIKQQQQKKKYKNNPNSRVCMILKTIQICTAF